MAYTNFQYRVVGEGGMVRCEMKSSLIYYGNVKLNGSHPRIVVSSHVRVI